MSGIGYSHPARDFRGCIYNGSECLAGWLERKFVNIDLCRRFGNLMDKLVIKILRCDLISRSIGPLILLRPFRGSQIPIHSQSLRPVLKSESPPVTNLSCGDNHRKCIN